MKCPYPQSKTDTRTFAEALAGLRAADRFAPGRLWTLLGRSIYGAYKKQLRRLAQYPHLHRDELQAAIYDCVSHALTKLANDDRTPKEADRYLHNSVWHAIDRLLEDRAEDLLPPRDERDDPDAPPRNDTPIRRVRESVRYGPRNGPINTVDYADPYERLDMIDDPELSDVKQSQLRRIFAAVLPQMAEVAVTSAEIHITHALLQGRSYEDIIESYNGLSENIIEGILDRLDKRVAWTRYLQLTPVGVAA
jgi:hypothetical protein